MNFFREMWGRMAPGRYARALEAALARERTDNHRLRAENRALLNSILGIAGLPPLPVSEADLAALPADIRGGIAGAQPEACAIESRPGQHRRGATTSPNMRRSEAESLAVPLRRRSWQQINRALELEALRNSD